MSQSPKPEAVPPCPRGITPDVWATAYPVLWPRIQKVQRILAEALAKQQSEKDKAA